ncbi:MAG: hypothetical protein V1645_05165 [archaeon]
MFGKKLVVLLLFSLAFVVFGALAPQLAVNDQTKECRIFDYPGGGHSLPEGWRFIERPYYINETKEHCESLGYQYNEEYLRGVPNAPKELVMAVWLSVLMGIVYLAVIWGFVKSKRKDYRRLCKWLVIVFLIFFGIYIFSYVLGKLIVL